MQMSGIKDKKYGIRDYQLLKFVKMSYVNQDLIHPYSDPVTTKPGLGIL